MSASNEVRAWKTILNISFRFAIPAVFFFYVFHVIRIDDVFFALKKIEWSWFYIGSACIFLLHFLCAFRTKKLTSNESQPLTKLWFIHSLSAVIAGMLPFRTGEVSYAYFLRKYRVVSGSQALAILISVRYLEYIFFLLFIFLLSAVGIFISPNKLNLVVFTLICINLGLILAITWKAGWLFRVLTGVSEGVLKLFISKNRLESLFLRVAQFTRNIQNVFAVNISKKLLFTTALIMLLRQGFILAMLGAMGVGISLWLLILLFAFLYAVKFIQGFGSFGSQESGIAAALILVGYEQNESLAIAIGTHLLQWTPILLSGLIGYVFLILVYRIGKKAYQPVN